MKSHYQLISVVSVLLGLANQACDPLYIARIKNNTSSKYEIEIKLDKEHIRKSVAANPNLYPDLTEVYRQVDSVIYTDTVNFIYRFILDPDSSYVVDGGMGGSPRFYDYESITIYGTDTLIIMDNKEEMIKLFKETGTRDFVLDL